MNYTLFTTTGCTRCHIVKKFMAEHGIAYTEFDVKGTGKEAFQKFYSTHRRMIFRGPEGIEFPLLTDGDRIYQGIASCLANLGYGDKLDGYFTVGTLHKEWVDGIHISDGSPEYVNDFLEILKYLKEQRFKLQVDTDGRNFKVLDRMLEAKLADSVVMNLLGPAEIYRLLFGNDLNEEDIEHSMASVASLPNHRFQTVIIPLTRPHGEISYLTSAEVSEAAQWLERVTGSKKNAYFVKPFDPKLPYSKKFGETELEPLCQKDLLVCRSAARKYQVFAEVG